jgi:hypothetical protein
MASAMAVDEISLAHLSMNTIAKSSVTPLGRGNKIPWSLAKLLSARKDRTTSQTGPSEGCWTDWSYTEPRSEIGKIGHAGSGHQAQRLIAATGKCKHGNVQL